MDKTEQGGFRMDLKRLQNLVPDVVFFVDRRCFPQWEIIRQTINFQDLTFVVEGKSNYFINGIKYTVEAGDVIYIPVGSVREAYTFTDCPMHSYAFNFKWLAPGRSEALPLQTVTKNLITSEILGYIKQFTQVWMRKHPGYIMHARALFMLIVHHVLITNTYRSAGHHPVDPRVNKVLEYIIDHYPEDLHLTGMADIVNLNPVYFGKLFKQVTGYSFKEYVNQIRINQAEMLLSTGGFTVTQVADRCGFHDISYFSNVFKSIKGYPPSAVSKS